MMMAIMMMMMTRYIIVIMMIAASQTVEEREDYKITLISTDVRIKLRTYVPPLIVARHALVSPTLAHPGQLFVPDLGWKPLLLPFSLLLEMFLAISKPF